MKKLGRLILCTLALILLFSAGLAEREIPGILRVTQDIEVEWQDYNRTITWSVVHTAREDVNKAVNARVAALKKEVVPRVPNGKDHITSPARGDIFTQITRTGSRWMSFHISAHVSANDEQKWVKSEDYTYEMDSGRLIRLGDIIRDDGWEALLREIRAQVENFFPGNTPDRNAVDNLCLRENLENAGFVMTPGHLALFFPASRIYRAHPEALLRVEIYVPELREILTEEALRETDCTGYSLVALTYDDGPTKGRTREVLNASIRYSGQVTFFLIGKRIQGNSELVHREFDAGHSVQSHTWAHSVDRDEVKPEKAARWDEKLSQAMTDVIGIGPVMMRPPGGLWKLYRNAGIETPMILWSVVTSDAVAPGKEVNVPHYIDCALSAKDGGIVLFHDGKEFAGELAETVMKRFEEKNMLLVTVNDLCALRGVPLEEGAIIHNCPVNDTPQ